MDNISNKYINHTFEYQIKIKSLSGNTISVFLLLMYSNLISLKRYIYGNSEFIIAITLFLSIFYFIFITLKHNNIYISTIESFWIISLLFILFNNYNFKNGNYSNFIHYFILVLFIMFSKYSKGWIESYWKIMIFFSFIHSICTVVFYLIPGFYTNYIIKIFGNTFYSSLIGWYKQGYATGLATHYSQNGIYLAIATGVAFCTLINNQRNRILNILFFTLCFIALLMSGKRGPLVFALLAMFFTYYVFTSNKPIRRLFKSFFMLGFILAAFLFIQAYIPVLANTLDRFTTTTGDFTGGRLELYRFAWKWFMESPLLGIGWGGYPYRINYTYIGLIYGQNTNMYVHNVYLQLLCEVGILGFVFFVTCIGLTLFKSIKMLMNYKKGKCIYNRIDTYCLTISLFIQLFFVLYSLSGNALYDYPILYPYLLSCAIPITIDYTLKKRGVHNDRNINLLQYH